MLLRIRFAVAMMDNMATELTAKRIWAKVVTVGLGKRSEHLDPIGPLVEAIGIVDGVPGLVPQQHHDDLLRLDLARLFLLDALQPAIEQIKWNADDGHFI